MSACAYMHTYVFTVINIHTTTKRNKPSNVIKDEHRVFVFNIFICLFSLFLFVLKFILCVFWTSFSFFFFFNGFCHLIQLNKITKNDFMLYNPPGGHSYWLHQGAIRQLWSNTVRGSSTLTTFLLHALRMTLEYLLG